MRDREYSIYMLLNTPGLGAKSISYMYRNLKNLGLNVNDLFEKSLTQLTEYFPEIGHGKFSRADLSALHSLDDDKLYTSYLQTELSSQTVQEPQPVYQINSQEDIKEKILSILNGKSLSSNEIIELAHLDWTPQQLTSYLKKVDEVELVKIGRSNYYKRKNLQAQAKLF